jgi:hypothetical protein
MSVRYRLARLVVAMALALPLATGAQPVAPPLPVAPPAGNAQVEADQPTLQDDRDAIDAGEKWLELIDAGKAGEAWDAAAKILKSSVTRKDWISGLSDIRKPYGKLVSRKPARFARTNTLPGAPDGDYAIVEFESVFGTRKNAVEQLTWTLEDGDTWRVSGYFIR